MPAVQIMLAHWGIVLAQLVVATICGGVIGFERERFEHPAGFRTHVLVCVGSAVYMMVSVAVAGDRFDPGRIAAQVASGIGFLGAGTIIKQGSIIRGLTTAASLWAVAGIGLAVGFSFDTLAIATLGTLVVFVTLFSLRKIEEIIDRRRTYTLTLILREPRQEIDRIKQILTDQGVEYSSIDFPPEQQTGPGKVVLRGYAPNRENFQQALNALAGDENVIGIQWDYL